MDYWGGGGAKGVLAPFIKLFGGPGPPGPPSSYAYASRVNKVINGGKNKYNAWRHKN